MARKAKRNYNSENLIKGQKILWLEMKFPVYKNEKKMKAKDQCTAIRALRNNASKKKTLRKNQKFSDIYI